MYLLMLLATFLASIHGFNLSARPDYDRDVARKKAMAVISRFMYQHRYATGVFSRVNMQSDGYEPPVAPPMVLPGDVVYGDVDEGEYKHYTMVYQQNHSSGAGEKKVLLRKVMGEAASDDFMQADRKLFPGDEMATKLICLKRKLECTEADTGDPICGGPTEMCNMSAHENDDGSGNVTLSGTCCNNSESRGGGYLVSFMKLDARWRNRISGGISFDFWRALEERLYNENVGIINWENGAWRFRGRMLFLPAYRKDMEMWMATNTDENAIYPFERKMMTDWVLPKLIFTRDFFTVNGVDMCENACLFRIKNFL
jgi:hypothetical protein